MVDQSKNNHFLLLAHLLDPGGHCIRGINLQAKFSFTVLEGTVCIPGINLKTQTEFDTSGGHYILGNSYSSKVRTFTLFDNHTSSRRPCTGHFTAMDEELLQLGNQVFSDSLLIAQETNQAARRRLSNKRRQIQTPK